MNLYQRLWDNGYADRRAKVLATGAAMNRKLAALQHIWKRMLRKEHEHHKPH